MLVSYKWLQDYVSISWSPRTLAKKLTDIGLEVKSVESNPNASGDAIIEIEVTPNRPDCLSIIGVSREISAILGQTLQLPDVKFSEDPEPADSLASVKIDAPDLCPRYCARVIRGIKIEPSPDWMVHRLESVGIRAINNVVDITNYVLMEYGHPLHAFDLNRLEGKQIIVRRANPNETMYTLDNQQRKLDSDRLVIADAKKPVALAGVMGGANSEVMNSTADLLIESAYFNPVSIRKTSKKLGLRTESSYRFERGTDPENAVAALNRATQLISELAGGKVAQGIIDVYPQPEEKRILTLRTSRVAQLLGIRLRQKSIAKIFDKLGCETKSESSEILHVTIPTFRRDLEREIDLIEEIARINGYDKVPFTSPEINTQPVSLSPRMQLERKLRTILTNLGFFESMTYSLISAEEWEKFGFPRKDMVALRNPLSTEQDVMRTSLLPGIAKTISTNLHLGQNVVRVFEIGRIFHNSSEPNKFDEENQLALAASGKTIGTAWEEKGITIDFYGMKGLIENLFQQLLLPSPKFVSSNSSFFKSGMSAEILANENSLGILGQISPELSAKLGVEKDLFYFDLNLDKLTQVPTILISYKPIPKYPAIIRDISILVPGNITSEQLQETIKASSNLIESVHLFDLYTGDKIPTGWQQELG